MPSGRPRRKIPLLRILLLIGVAIFVYLKFDAYWPALRATLNPAAAWNRLLGRDAEAPAAPSRAAWSADSTRLALECPGGLDGCCEDAVAGPSLRGVCGQAAALISRARWKGVAADGAEGSSLRLEARAGYSAEGFRFFDLASLRGRDERSAFHFRKGSDGTWCEARRGCLTTPSPRAPLSGGRLSRGPGENVGRWIAGVAAVHPSLPGRVVAVDSAAGGARVRVYHGGELYTSYEPLRAAPDVRPGLAVTAGTVLGAATGGPKGYTVYMRIRRAGLNADPFAFFALQAPAPGAGDSLATDSAGDSTAAAAAGPTD